MSNVRMSGRDQTALEQMIDTYGLKRVVETLGQLCGEKGEHLRSGWQDSAMARDWYMAGVKLENAARLRAVENVSPPD